MASTVLQKAGAVAMPLLMTALCRTLSFDLRNAPSAKVRPCVIAFWHGSMIAPFWIHRRDNVVALVSQSSDGGILSNVLRSWGYGLIRGSSSTGGSDALARMVEAVNAGNTLLITPDGPRGPRQQMKRGAALVAQRTGRPLILAGVNYFASKPLWGWDHFEIPCPMTRARITYSDPIEIPVGLSGERFDARIAALSAQLRELGSEWRIAPHPRGPMALAG
jgi:lysophospholipid acyltransferase (LPLAT)-like uncharacterized protein